MGVGWRERRGVGMGDPIDGPLMFLLAVVALSGQKITYVEEFGKVKR